MPLESIQLGVLTSAPFLAATWDRLFTPPLEALEVAIAIRVNVAEGEERSGQRQESEGRAPPTELHLA